jgi:hypothetical protein
MHRSKRLVLRAGAAGVVALAPLALTACKVQPVNGNVDPRQPVAGAQLTGDATADLEQSKLGPAAKSAVKYLPMGWAPAPPETKDRADAPTFDEVRMRDRWRIGYPAWERGSQTDSPWDKGAWWDPYHQNWLKGDYAIPGTQNTFLQVEAQSITSFESKKLPTPSGVHTRDPGNRDFFGSYHQRGQAETLTVSVDLQQGETSFKPVDWRVFLKGATQWNYAAVEENAILYADPSEGRTRNDSHVALQQAFFETTLASVTPKYDVIQARLGIQQFNSDFRGLMFFDETLGARLFGNLDDNRWQWNLAWFPRLEKDTNSGLNELRRNGQDLFVANVYRQDVLGMLLPHWKAEDWSHGLTSSLSVHWLSADKSVEYDENDFLVRPRAVGTPVPNDSRTRWIGWTNDGHIDRLNVNTAIYRADGTGGFDEIAGREVDIGAWLAATELSIDKDWMRFRLTGLWQSGDDDPLDGQASGFDAPFDNPNYAGGEFGFWNRNSVRLTGSGVGLNQGGSLYNTLRSSKNEGNPAFVNPGLKLLGAGWDAQLTPHLKLITNASHLWFDDTSSMEYVLGQGSLGGSIGWDLSAGVVWRPLLTDNVIVKTGVSALVPGNGFRDIYTADTLYAFFAEVILTW